MNESIARNTVFAYSASDPVRFERETRYITVRKKILSANNIVDKKTAEDICYPDKYQQFVNLWLWFKMDSFGKATVTISQLIDDLGWSGGSSKTVSKARKIIDDTLSSERQKSWPVSVAEVISHKMNATLNDAVYVSVKKNDLRWDNGEVGISIDADRFSDIIRLGRDNHVCSADLLEYYFFFLSSMNTTKEADFECHGALIHTTVITNRLGISLKTHYKYREILNNAGVLYYFKGMDKVPAGYALENSSFVFNALISRYNRNAFIKGKKEYIIDKDRRQKVVEKSFGVQEKELDVEEWEMEQIKKIEDEEASMIMGGM